ncbi:ATP-binding protein [Thiocystis violacea]|uniref:ATP-binding protein n=1 Tax=Thiocystis violacea TaxID=13725 RepID=UPI001902DDF6|nr:ATP-binding protein [Thiocystis violacea]MBK1718753.1 hypothetical protein [Thiocystis violacea]
MHVSDIMMHFQDPLEPDQRRAIESEVRALDGVIAPRFNKPRLCLVAYDPDRTTAAALLGLVRAKGYRANLVGL